MWLLLATFEKHLGIFSFQHLVTLEGWLLLRRQWAHIPRQTCVGMWFKSVRHFCTNRSHIEPYQRRQKTQAGEAVHSCTRDLQFESSKRHFSIETIINKSVLLTVVIVKTKRNKKRTEMAIFKKRSPNRLFKVN